ncbi:hypothetical protein GCM10010459_18410 [Microbacterium schleiferi]
MLEPWLVDDLGDLVGEEDIRHFVEDRDVLAVILARELVGDGVIAGGSKLAHARPPRKRMADIGGSFGLGQ